MATRLVEQWLKIARGEITSQTNISQISVKPIPNNCDSNTNNVVDFSTVDGSSCVSDLTGNAMDVDDVDCAQEMEEPGQTEGLVFKITMKDGKLTKINETSPKKNGNRISSESHKDSDSDSSRSTKARSEKSRSDEGRHKDGKERERSKDGDKHRKSSSSSSHKVSSSGKISSSSSSSKHNSSSSSSKSSSSHSKSHKSSSSSSGGHKSSSGSQSSSSRDKDKHKSSSSSSSKSSSSSSKDSSKDKKSSSESSKTQAEKDKDTLAKIQPKSLEKVGKIPKKTSSSSSTDSATKKPTETDAALAAKKKSISIEVRKDTENRPKTVKTYNSQFRSHGLGEEAPPPPSRRDLKKPTAAVPVNGIPIVPKRALSPTNATKELEKKLKLNTSPVVDKPGAIKLIPAKPKRKYSIESEHANGEILFSLPVSGCDDRVCMQYVKRLWICGCVQSAADANSGRLADNGRMVRTKNTKKIEKNLNGQSISIRLHFYLSFIFLTNTHQTKRTKPYLYLFTDQPNSFFSLSNYFNLPKNIYIHLVNI